VLSPFTTGGSTLVATTSTVNDAGSTSQARLLFEEEKGPGIRIYPNPANNRVFIALNAGSMKR
jgi:hypothetical protein